MVMDFELPLKLVAFLVPLVGSIVGGWALMRKQGDRTERAVEVLSTRIDTKFEKISAALTSVQEVSGESMRRVMAAWGRIEEESKRSAEEREERARLQEQLKAQRDLIADLKRTQELNLADVRRALEHRQQ